MTLSHYPFIGQSNSSVSSTEEPSRNQSNNNLPVSISIPPEAFQTNTSDNGTHGMIFAVFTDSALFPLRNETRANFSVASTVLSATIAEQTVAVDLERNVTIVLHLGSAVSDVGMAEQRYMLYEGEVLDLHTSINSLPLFCNGGSTKHFFLLSCTVCCTDRYCFAILIATNTKGIKTLLYTNN